MFGYIAINEPELKIKDFLRYRGYYCGVCHSLKQRHGKRGQATLSYDMTFLAILLSGLYEETPTEERRRCFAHPWKKHLVLTGNCTEYAADMNLLLTYYSLEDHWRDDHKITAGLGARLLRGRKRRLEQQYPRQSKAVADYVEHLTECERKHRMDLDLAAGLTGTCLGELFVSKEDQWQEELRRMGFYLGKFIYLMDAYEDAEQDAAKGSYNPWVPYMEQETFEETVRETLTMMMSQCAMAFERLPILQEAEILRNILYSGVWLKYEGIRGKKHE